MMTAKQAKREAKQLFRLCLVGRKLDEERTRMVVERILQSKPRGYLRLLGFFLKLVKFDYFQRTAQIECAVPVSPALQARVQAGIESVYGQGITSLFVLNPALIGGMRIKVGSDVYDGSIRSRLATLAKSFGIASTNGQYASV
jgi:F-type H+-transporting ATPase subunit delta